MKISHVNDADSLYYLDKAAVSELKTLMPCGMSVQSASLNFQETLETGIIIINF